MGVSLTSQNGRTGTGPVLPGNGAKTGDDGTIFSTAGSSVLTPGSIFSVSGHPARIENLADISEFQASARQR
jgi:hypothetical protein